MRPVNFLLLVALGLGVRLIIRYAAPSKVLESFTYSPVDQWESVLEGVYLRNAGFSTYDNDIVHQAPLILSLWQWVLSHSSQYAVFYFLFMEIVLAFSLVKLCDVSVDAMCSYERQKQNMVHANCKDLLRSKEHFRLCRGLALLWFCFNPYSILAFAGQSTSVVWNIVSVWTMIACIKDYLFLSSCLCALGCYLRLYPGFLLIPIVAKACATTSKRTLFNRFLRIICTLTGFSISLAGLLYASYLSEGNDWSFLDAVYLHQLRFSDCSPQLGLYWYLFVEMFEHFHEFFIWVFQLLLATLVVALGLRFHREPLLLGYLVLLVTNVLQPYHSVGEFGYLLALLPLWSHLYKYCRIPLVVVLVLLSALILTPLLYYLWLQPGTANANFYFAACMAYAVGQLDCQSRLTGIPPECAPSPRTIARAECSRPSAESFRVISPVDEHDKVNGGSSECRAPRNLALSRRDYPVTHPPTEVPFCEACRQQDADMLAASELKSPSPTGLPSPDDDDASRSWIFKQLPGPWWWCEDCQASVNLPQVTIAHLFAVLRQWTPYAQLQLITIVEEIFRRGAHVDDRDGLTDMTLLHYTAKIAEFLLDGGACLEARCKFTDMTPLHYAAYFDCPMLVELFLNRGADIKARSRLLDGATPLHLATTHLSLGAAKVLIQASFLSLAREGVESNGKDALDSLGRTPYDCLPPSNQLTEPLCSLRERLAELLVSGSRKSEHNEPSEFSISSSTISNAAVLDSNKQTLPAISNGNAQTTSTMGWLVAESGCLAPRNRTYDPPSSQESTPPSSRRPPSVPRPVPINHPLPPTSSVSAKVTLQSLGLSLNDRVCIGSGGGANHTESSGVGGRIGRLRYCGPVEFASGIWVGIELDEPLGRNNGSVSGVQYFSCSPKHGVFAPIGRVYKAVTDETNQHRWHPIQGKHTRPGTPRHLQETDGFRRSIPVSRSSYSLSNPSDMESSQTTSPSPRRIDVSHVKAKVDTGLRSQSASPGPVRPFRLGDRVLVAGDRRGVVRFIGETRFAPGVWYGIELEQPVGKNNGSVDGFRYFECPMGYGIFASENRLQRLPPTRSNTPSSVRQGVNAASPASCSRVGSTRRRMAWSTTTSPMIGRAVVGRPSLPSDLLSALEAAERNQQRRDSNLKEPRFYLCEGMQVLCAGEMGIVRYIGPISFAEGIWLGLELRKPRGRHDGSIAGKRYFQCRPGHGLLVRPSRVFCRGINAVNLLPPALGALERELAEKRQAEKTGSDQLSSGAS